MGMIKRKEPNERNLNELVEANKSTTRDFD
jgi:hypothetical protein